MQIVISLDGGKSCISREKEENVTALVKYLVKYCRSLFTLR